ncbi:cell division cycle-associated protein 2 isoform 1-T1 [Menidia menidia]
MTTVETITAGTKEDQENMPPLKDCTPSAVNEPAVPLNFPGLTPSQFGISVGSFTPSSSSNLKDKSRLAQIKARRRSSIGVRGSPETNSLIRFMAQHRMKTPPTSQTPEPVGGTPFFPRVASTLRQKMASFQSLMDGVESDACDPVPAQDHGTGGCIRTGDYRSDGISCSAGKENDPPTKPTPSKRRRLGPPESCSGQISEAAFPVPLPGLKEEEAAACGAQSPGRPPCGDHAGASGPQRSPASLPPPAEMKPSGEADPATASAAKKKKQVRFGGPLSPEFFDKNLPPNTPLLKGGTPARGATPGGSAALRSLLRTPQRSPSQTTLPQPERHSPDGGGASPTFAIPRGGGGAHGKVVEDSDETAPADTECIFDTRPLNLDAAFLEESLSHAPSKLETKPKESFQTAVVNGCEFTPEEKQPQAGAEGPAPALTSKRRRKLQTSPEEEPATEAPPRSQRKRKVSALTRAQATALAPQQPAEGQAPKRSTRSAAKSACGRIKVASAAVRRWSKGVDRSLYGSRSYASKNPALSPITERRPLSWPAPDAWASDEESVDEAAGTGSASPPGLFGSAGRAGGLRKRPSEELRGHADGDHTSVQRQLLRQEEPVDEAELCVQISADARHPQPEKTELCEALQASPSACPPPGEGWANPEPAPSRARRGRRSSAPRGPPQERQSGPAVDEDGQGGPADDQQEQLLSAPASLEEAGAPGVELAPWQADFNFEDVFRAVSTRGQRSVRRSLRNQSSEQSAAGAGLAWLPHTSPEARREARRRGRSRRRPSAAPPVQPVQPPLPEDTQDPSLKEPSPKGSD